MATNNKDKKYTTVEKEDKRIILADLTKGLLILKSAEFDQEDLENHDIRELIESTDLNEYNHLLTTILNRHFGPIECTVKYLTQWRKKIKNWIKSIDKPETRGGVVISPEVLGYFKARLFMVLDQLPYRCFTKLRSHVLAILKEFPTEYQKTVNPKTCCSKHWWFNFLQKNEDVKEKWESIPLERSLNKTNRVVTRKGSHSDIDADSNNSTTGNTNSQANSPTAVEEEAFESDVDHFFAGTNSQASSPIFAQKAAPIVPQNNIFEAEFQHYFMEEEKIIPNIGPNTNNNNMVIIPEVNKVDNFPAGFLDFEDLDFDKFNPGFPFFDIRDFQDGDY